MKKKSIFIAIFLGLISLSSILLIQYIWIKKALVSQQTEIELQARKDSLNTIEFERNVQIALREVSIKIAYINNDVSDRYGSVKKLENNLFYVEYQGEMETELLKNLLFRELERMHVTNDFQLAMNDCYTNKLEFSRLFRYNIDEGVFQETNIHIDPFHLKPSTKSNFFVIYFPMVFPQKLYESSDIGTPWLFLVLVCLLILIYLTYSVVVIVRQKRLSDIKTDFINNMTHELKTPIATIKLSSTALLTNDFSSDSERLQRYAGIIYSENKRLEEQVERVLTIAKMDKRSTPLKKSFSDIHDFIMEAYETLEETVLELGGSFETELNAKNHTLYVDPVHIKNVVFNLLDNAIKYRREDTPIRLKVTTENDKKNFIFKVSDNGIGIEKSELKLIFDKFYRIPKGDVHDAKGFGLGLYYVKNIIGQHQGTVQLKSEKGEGTTFIVHLPLRKIED